jgi:HPt (histidine-containing phosphotransfer) domain-containing protein
MSASPPPRLDGYDAILKKPLSPESLRAAFARRVSPANGAERPRAPHDPKEDAVLDAEIFERLRRAIDPDGLEEVFSVFLKDTHERIAAMRDADPATIRREAHTIKGGASMVGALQISRAAAAIESGIDDPDDRLRKLDEMESQCRFAAIILKQRLKA